MEKNLLHIKKQMELLKYSIENDAIQKLEPLTNYYFIQTKQIATSINNKEIINAINNWYDIALYNVKNKNITELSNNVDMIIAWINTLIIESRILR
jgi:hypothetical protein